MKILMLVNWKVEYYDSAPLDKQPPDYYVKGEPYWFFRYFKNLPEVDVVDVSSFPRLEHFEKEKLRFYIWQTLKVLPKLNQYDLIISHGAQSGVLLSLWRRFFKTRAKHILFDIGSFNSAAESGFALKLMQFASKSIDGLIYHTSSQKEYYEQFFPWLVDRSRFIRFGTDLEFFNPDELQRTDEYGKYFICVGAAKRDWDTLVTAYQMLDTDMKLRLVGRVDEKYQGIKGVEQIPFVPIKELINQIYNAAFAVLPLEQFNYSYGQMTLMQQMALGKCVVAARVNSLVDYIGEDTTVLYEPGNASDLAEKLKTVIDDAALCEEIAAKGRQYLHDACNERVMAEEIEFTVRDLME